jgi:hypothetical protein
MMANWGSRTPEMMLLESASRFAQGFGDLYHGGRLAGPHGDEGIGDAHVFGVDAVVAKQHLAVLYSRRQWRPRDFAVTLHYARVGRHHLVEQQVGLVGAQHGACRGRQVHRHPLAVDFHQFHDGRDVVGQVLVVGLVGEEAGDVVGRGD